MDDYERGKCSPISKHYEFSSTKKMVKIIKFYRILFALQISIILIYYIYNLCV
uniref:Uncharacterized protein n=1 Tax=viral metagenome TaxID=1070528 RepID=A0A6C0LGC2_9ZZZZ